MLRTILHMLIALVLLLSSISPSSAAATPVHEVRTDSVCTRGIEKAQSSNISTMLILRCTPEPFKTLVPLLKNDASVGRFCRSVRGGQARGRGGGGRGGYANCPSRLQLLSQRAIRQFCDCIAEEPTCAGDGGTCSAMSDCVSLIICPAGNLIHS